ncbi:MAG: hypothetical protein JST77_11170 [Acidobacteria bacterium]|nr:hypothetical protein [Acidobacteriota bacterium]
MAKAKTEESAEARKPPKGGRVGGTIFPRVPLDDALKFAETLARKTLGGPQPIETVLVSVFNNKGPEGQVRASALKQFGLLDGTAKEGGYVATSLAREIDAAVPEERPAMWRRAFLTSKIFAQIYDALQGDTVTKARVRQIAMTNGVHGSNADLCVDLFIEGAIKAGLATSGPDDKYVIAASTGIAQPPSASESDESGTRGESETLTTAATPTPAVATPVSSKPSPPPPRLTADGPTATKAGAQLQLHVDSSSDPDKLRKQLELLREFGMI